MLTATCLRPQCTYDLLLWLIEYGLAVDPSTEAERTVDMDAG
jgi:hypothetical protein